MNLVIDYRGKTPKKLGADWAKCGYRALSAKNIKTGKIVNESSIRFVDECLYRKWMKDEICKGDILITSEAPFGQVFLWNSDEKIVLSQRLFCIRLNHDVDPMFVYHVMASNDFQAELDGHATGTTVTGLRQPELLRCKITLPPLPTQQKIAAILSALDAKIENNNAINKNLEAQAQALFKSWFVDNREDSWENVPLSNLLDFLEGPGIRNWQYVESDGTKFINIKCIKDGDININDANMISDEEATGKYAHFLLAPYDIVMSCSGTLGRYAIVRKEHLPLCLNTSVIRFRTKQQKEDFAFIYGYLSSKEFLNRQEELACGSVQSNFGPIHLKSMTLCEPPSELRKKYSDVVLPLLERVLNNRRENTRLAALRDTLLPKLMSGEIEV